MAPEGPSPIPINAPQGAPMSAPNPKEGLQARAKIEISQALQLLKKNLQPDLFPVDSPEWKALYSSIKNLGKLGGEESGNEVSAAGLKLLASSLSPKGMSGIMGGQGGGGGAGGMPMAGPGPMSIGGM